MNKIDSLIQNVKSGNETLQFMEGQFFFLVIYMFNQFFIEKYKHCEESEQPKLVGVECVNEETIRFALSTRY